MEYFDPTGSDCAKRGYSWQGNKTDRGVMKGKLLFVAGAAVGYVLGTRAGRKRYEQIKGAAESVWNTPVVQQGVGQVKDFALARVGTVSDAFFDNAKKLVNAATTQAKASGDATKAPAARKPAVSKPATSKPAAKASSAAKSTATKSTATKSTAAKSTAKKAADESAKADTEAAE